MLIAAFLILLAVSFIIFLRHQPVSKPQEEYRRWADTIAKSYLGTLQTILFSELQKGIPTAIRVCADTAQKLTQQFSKKYNAQIRRVSLKPRNPADTADWHERKILIFFEQQKQRNILLDTLVVIDSLTIGGIRYYRYLKPIVISTPLCLNCHGTQETIPKEIQVFLQERYPNDQATGYKFGDLRGALSITWIPEKQRGKRFQNSVQ